MNIEVGQQISVSAPARLHFGLFSIGHQTDRQFGGAGMMIDRPRTIVRAQPSDRLRFTDESAQRLLRPVIELWLESNRLHLPKDSPHSSLELPFEFAIESMAPSHSGFGSGTQRALATALLLSKLCSMPQPSATELALSVKRGRRSAIGTHGFERGGFLVDEGKLDSTPISPLDIRVAFPSQWRVVTILTPPQTTVFGQAEIEAFRDLPPVSEQFRDAMTQLMKDRVVPALIQKNYKAFGESIYEFGTRSGSMFEAIQGSAFNGKKIEDLVNRIRRLGVPAVGQSSWGPCVYAIVETESKAATLKREIDSWSKMEYQVEVCSGDNQGATLTEKGLE